ncbi:hypothetical protein SETIT_1G155600v2 [Setaria italica]|uniref:Uncharacterized protein n=2 Tax=Setaria TaxID=4554 RepID=A0A368PLH6_SETIT|nr:hypothetical protein SETIT_1G155600v2 [Setaria italica]
MYKCGAPAWNDCMFFPQSVTAKREPRLPTQTGQQSPRYRKEGAQISDRLSFFPTTFRCHSVVRLSCSSRSLSFLLPTTLFLFGSERALLHGLARWKRKGKDVGISERFRSAGERLAGAGWMLTTLS